MEVRRRGVGIPEQLGVVVGVGVDEAGRDDEAGGVDDVGVGPDAVVVDVADDGDAAVDDAEVGNPDRVPRCRRRWSRP